MLEISEYELTAWRVWAKVEADEHKRALEEAKHGQVIEHGRPADAPELDDEDDEDDEPLDGDQGDEDTEVR